MQFNDDNENDATWLKRKEEALENLKNSIFRALRQNKKSLKTYDYLQDIKSYEKDKLFISLSPFFIVPFILLSNRIPLFS